MLRLTIIWLLISIHWLANGQTSIVKNTRLTRENYQVVISEESTVKILGKTNINKFECTYCGNISADTLYVGMLDSRSKQNLVQADLKIPVMGFDCGLKMMTRDMMKLLEAENHPLLKVKVLDLKKQGMLHEATVRYTIAGTSRDYCVPLMVQENDKWTYCVGVTEINIEDFGLEPPVKFLGAVKVKKTIKVEFNLILKIREQSNPPPSKS